MKKGETTATQHHGKSDMMDIMNQMSRKMGSAKMKGDVDHDFAEMMVIHHQAAIEMAQQEVYSGQDATLQKLAKKMIEDQIKEIKEMQQWLKDQHQV